MDGHRIPLALAGSLPLAGWLGTRLGVGRVWLGAPALFTATSGGLRPGARNIATLIVLRVLQGLAGGLLIPPGQTVLGQAVGSRRLGRVMATLGIAVTAAPALGPVIGGLLLQAGTWRWLFVINLPIGAVGLLLGARYIPHDRGRTTAALDWPALAGISTGLPLLCYGLTKLSGHPNPLLTTVLALGAGPTGLAGFVARTRASRDPLINLTLMHDRAFAAATVASGTTGMLMFGSGLLFPSTSSSADTTPRS